MYFKPHRLHNMQIFSHFYSKQIIFHLLSKEKQTKAPVSFRIFMQYVHTVLFLSHTVCRSHASGTFIKHVLHIFLQIVIYSKLFP